MFDMLDESAYFERPIALRNPVVFYEGHIPAFAVNTLVKKALGKPGIDEHLEIIFARGIDPTRKPRQWRAATPRGHHAKWSGSTPTQQTSSFSRPSIRLTSIAPVIPCSIPSPELEAA